jgi:hypothetical protein
VPHLHVVLLWRSVLWRAHSPHHGLCLWVTGVPQLDQPEIHQHCLPAGTEDDVLGLDVPVEHSLAVAICQRIQQLFSPHQHVGLWQCSLSLDALGQTLSFDEIHHEVGAAPLLEKVAYPHHVRMSQASQDLCLLLKLPAKLGQRLVV